MVIGIIGENCTGKSSLAQAVQEALGGEIITGKDYLRMAKSESMAAALFKKKLRAALEGENVIYVISEAEHLDLLPEGSVTVLVKAELDVIKERFRARMRGNLPAPVEAMLEKKHGMFDGGSYSFRFHSGRDDLNGLLEQLRQL
ncbi:MAG: hypothetical protein IKB09_01155 [Oscillospiraceae bacterium]|nr:hypothetical protein [Oscillospiraceae bacterium]